MQTPEEATVCAQAIASQVVDLKDIPRFVELGIIPSMQATHATSDMYWAEDRVGADRIQGAYAWQKFLQQGDRKSVV